MIYEIRVFKNLNGIGSRGEWVNSYHYDTAKAIDDPELARAALELARMEAKFHLANVTFTRALISPYHARLKPIDEREGIEVVLGFNGLVVDAVEAGGTSRLLPAESTVVVKRGSGKGRAGRATYRHAIATQDWIGAGEGIRLTQQKIDQVNGACGFYMEQINAVAPLTKPARTADGTPGRAVSRMVCAGTQNRQVNSRRRGQGQVTSKTPIATLAKPTGNIISQWLSHLLTAPTSSTLDKIGDVAPVSILAYDIALKALQAYNEILRRNGQQPIPLPPAPVRNALPG